MSAQPKALCKGTIVGRLSDGEPRPCRRTAIDDDGYCFLHKPKPPKEKPPLPYATSVKCKWEEKQCANPAGASGYCWTHDPAAYERCKRVVSKGAGVARQCLNRASEDGYCRNHARRWRD